MTSNFIDISDLKKRKDFILGYGHFTTIHPGHIRYLKHAKSLGNTLIIALKGDGVLNNQESKYQFNQGERAEALALLDIADFLILLNDDEIDEIVKATNPKLLILGKQFEKSPEEKVQRAIQFLSKRGISTFFHGGDVNYFNAELLTSSEDEMREKRMTEFVSSCKRQSLTRNDLLQSIEKWEKANLIVIGDTIVDRYVACEALGMSAEAPVVVVKELENRDFCGGAAIVASHIRSLGAKCKLISVIGDDNCGSFVRDKISEIDISDGLIQDKSRPTTFKKRYLVENQKLFRVTRLEQTEINKSIESQIIAELEFSAKEANGIVISDFVYGVITHKILLKIDELAKKYNLKVFGDLQCSSQVGSILKFNNLSLLCPNEREARIALHEKDLDLETLSLQIIKKTNSSNLIMKLGSAGFIVYFRKNNNINKQAFPALSINPVDVSGAGDSLLAVMAVGLSSSQDIVLTSAIACCMASLSVERMGNKPIKSEELKYTIINKLKI